MYGQKVKLEGKNKKLNLPKYLTRKVRDRTGNAREEQIIYSNLA